MATVEHLSKPAAAASARAVWRARLAIVAAAAGAALAVWALIELAFGFDIRSPGFGGDDAADVGAVQVLVAASVGGLAGWALLALLERFTTRGRRVWAGLAVLALLLSFGGPLSGDGVSDKNRALLLLLHLTAGAVLIPLLYRSSRSQPEPIERRS